MVNKAQPYADEIIKYGEGTVPEEVYQQVVNLLDEEGIPYNTKYNETDESYAIEVSRIW
ncbi:hypothetical protein [Pseudalkalibacillus caeni]|uniref:hypothetical protein n=1 Tax=Exobacillus caeni TaxID=2574798 RepID=UPI001484D7A2|nr:hypothetical protein [Pseudalkalibacillus caeni]